MRLYHNSPCSRSQSRYNNHRGHVIWSPEQGLLWQPSFRYCVKIFELITGGQIYFDYGIWGFSSWLLALLLWAYCSTDIVSKNACHRGLFTGWRLEKEGRNQHSHIPSRTRPGRVDFIPLALLSKVPASLVPLWALQDVQDPNWKNCTASSTRRECWSEWHSLVSL